MNKISNRAVRFAVLAAALAPLGLSLAACNTTAGLGQDVKHTGQAITNSADKNNPSQPNQ